MDTDNVSKALDNRNSLVSIFSSELRSRQLAKSRSLLAILYPGQRHSEEQNGKSLELLEDRFHLLWSGSGRCDIIISS